MFSCGRVARVEQVVPGVGAHRPVVVLARAVDAGERLLVQQADEAVAAGHVLHDLHRQLLVVGADVRVLEDRRDLVLARRDLVVAGLDRHAELGQLALGLEHEGEHALGDRAEVVVVELVALRRLGAEQRAAGGDQVGALEEVLLVDQEVLLLGADRGEDALGVLVAEQPQRADRRLRERVHRAQQRDLGVERLAGPRRERGRDAEQRAVRVLEDERRAGRVPGGVAAGLEGGADAAGRERGGVRLALDQLLAGEVGDRAAVAGRARRTSRASRRSGRSAAGTSGCSGWRRARAPSPSSPSATASASVGSSASPRSSVAWSFLKTSFGQALLLDRRRRRRWRRTGCWPRRAGRRCRSPRRCALQLRAVRLCLRALVMVMCRLAPSRGCAARPGREAVRASSQNSSRNRRPVHGYSLCPRVQSPDVAAFAMAPAASPVPASSMATREYAIAVAATPAAQAHARDQEAPR